MEVEEKLINLPSSPRDVSVIATPSLMSLPHVLENRLDTFPRPYLQVMHERPRIAGTHFDSDINTVTMVKLPTIKFTRVLV